YMGAAFLYDVSAGKTTQVTDGLSNVTGLAFDRSGKYLFFTASTDVGPRINGFDMSSYEHPVTSNAYVILLRKDLPSPLEPESDEEKPKDEKPTTPPAKPEETKTVIDFDSIDQR